MLDEVFFSSPRLGLFDQLAFDDISRSRGGRVRCPGAPEVEFGPVSRKLGESLFANKLPPN